MEQVLLRDVVEKDLPIFFRNQNIPAANLMAAFKSRSWNEFLIHWTKRILGNDAVVVKTIVVGADVVGNVLSFKHENQRFVGYWIGSEYWGRGIASQALREFLTIIQQRPLYAYVANHNLASRRVLEKSGFTALSEHMLFSETHGCEIKETLMVQNT